MSFSLSQTTQFSQKQIQKMSQAQIQSLKYLAMNSFDLRNEIYNEVEKNPALEIVSDKNINSLDENFSDRNFSNENFSRDFKNLSDYTKVSTATSSGIEKSDAYQNILESKADLTETLSDHLLSQFELINLPENQVRLGKKLIFNLDKNGFHILAPSSFLDFQTDTENDLESVLEIIQNLEPVGCCVKNFEESLFVQAKATGVASDLALFLLDGHFDFLDPPQSQKVLKRLKDFVETEKSKFGQSSAQNNYNFIEEIDAEDVDDAISFIQTLNPHPASEFTPDENFYIQPEIYVEKVFREFFSSSENQEKGDNFTFVVKSAKNILPEIQVSSTYSDLAKNKNLSSEQKSAIEKMILDGKSFIQSIQFREDSVLNAASVIVNAQVEFFKKGPGNLMPLKQKDVAEILGVHETTVSRIANSKYLECEWGLFPLKYFFINGIENENGDEVVSKDKILVEIKKILAEYENSANGKSGKKLSDQKISDLLSQKNIKVARRTVAKYRTQLGLK